ncbi:MAG: hypothetical protein ACOY46_10590 [Bacillota bacterium]
MRWLLLLVPLIISYYTFTYGLWAWRNGNRRGGAGVYCLAAFTLAISVYALFIRKAF